MIFFLAKFFLSIMLSLMIHELSHFLMAIVLGYQPHIHRNGILNFAVTYRNQQNDKHNLMIAAIAPVMSIMVGILLPNGQNLMLLKLFCLSNIFNLLPVTSDGEVILLSIINILRKRRNEKNT